MAESTSQLVARAKAMVAQTAAQGSKAFAGSSYDTSAKPTPTPTPTPTPSTGGSTGGSTGVSNSTPDNQQKIGVLNQQLADAQAKLKELTDAGYSGSDVPSYDSTGKLIPKSTNPSNTSTPTTYYPYQRAGNIDTGFANAQANLTPQPAQTEQDFYNKVYAQLQPVLDSIQQAEQVKEGAANIEGTKATSEMNFALGSRGLAGSSEGAAMSGQVEQARNQAIAQAKSEQATAVGNLVQWAIPEAQAEFQAAQTRNDTLSQNYINTAIQKAQNSIKGIAQSGMTFSDFQKTQPDAFNNLLQYYNGDANQMKADFIAAIPNIDLSKAIQSGSNLIVPHIDPTTGQPTIEVLDTGVQLTADEKVVKGADGGVVIYNSRTGKATSLGGGNPYYMANQKSLAEGRTQMVESRKALIASRVIGSQVKSDAAIQNFQKIAPLMGSLQATYDEIKNGNLNEETAARLLDNITQLNTGGKVITEGQIALTKDSQSYIDRANVILNKIKGSGGVIDEKVAKDMADLAQKTYNLYEKQYQQHIQVYNNRLKDVNGQDLTAYSPLTDISNLPSVLSGDYDKALSAGSGTGVGNDTGTGTAQTANPGDTVEYNGAQYTVGDDGETLIPAQQ